MKDKKLVEDGFKVAVLGDDARALAMIKALDGDGVVILAIGDKINPQTAEIAQWNVAAKDPLQIAQLIEAWGAELVIIGTEKYLLPIDDGAGGSIVDTLERAGIAVASPGYIPSLIELDKAWMIKLAIKYGMAKFLPESRVFQGAASVSAAQKAIDELESVAVKPAELTEGKGVKVTGIQFAGNSEAKKYTKELLLKKHKVIIQKKISGDEFSLQGFVYDKCGFIAFAPLVVDYKLLYDDDIGIRLNPNTGGMGSKNYADGFLPNVNREICSQAKEIIKRIVSAIEEETGEGYKGMIYGQFMLGEDGRIYLIEINARLGNSEALNILPLLPKGDFLNICRDMVASDDNPICPEIRFRKKASVVKYVVPRGYPASSRPVVINLRETDKQVELFFGGIKEEEGLLITDGSRAIAVRAEADTVPEASEIINGAIPEIFEDCIEELHWRPCIGLENH